jgi:protein-S-isoprenylcysteine O-methyltransferase Ste14
MRSLVEKIELKLPPVPGAVITAWLMWRLARAFENGRLLLPWRVFIGCALAATGLAVTLAGVLAFRRAQTTINPLHPETAARLVASGIYRRTRNPMYVGLLLALMGWAWYLAHPLAAVLPFVFAAYLTRFQIEPEERALAARFGEEFSAYRATTRRWL